MIVEERDRELTDSELEAVVGGQYACPPIESAESGLDVSGNISIQGDVAVHTALVNRVSLAL